jgi:hypothetical protein
MMGLRVKLTMSAAVNKPWARKRAPIIRRWTLLMFTWNSFHTDLAERQVAISA